MRVGGVRVGLGRGEGEGEGGWEGEGACPCTVGCTRHALGSALGSAPSTLRRLRACHCSTTTHPQAKAVRQAAPAATVERAGVRVTAAAVRTAAATATAAAAEAAATKRMATRRAMAAEMASAIGDGRRGHRQRRGGGRGGGGGGGGGCREPQPSLNEQRRQRRWRILTKYRRQSWKRFFSQWLGYLRSGSQRGCLDQPASMWR